MLPDEPNPAPAEASPGGETARGLSARSARRALWEIAQTAVQALALYLVVTAFVGRFEVHQISMEPNFHEGQRVVVSQFGSLVTPWLADTAYAADGRVVQLLGPKRGQVVVFHPDAERQQDPLIKRVVGLPGETVEVRDGVVWVEGARLDEPYLSDMATTCYGNCVPLTLGPDEYFVLGDNRPNSRDSRSFGAIHLDQIVGRVVLRYWPLDTFQVYP